jgi:hypothetical protein
MGLGITDLSLLIQLAESGHIESGQAVIEIGAQQLSDDFLQWREGLAHVAAVHGISAPCPLPAPLGSTGIVHGKLLHLSPKAPLASQFWTWLGYRYASIDIDGTPGSIPLDLNYDDAPEAHRGAYRIVTNCGTTEHVANQLNAFKIIHELAAVGGVMVHNLPAQGMFNHGFVNYNPKFFWMLARSNGYRLVHMNFSSHDSYYPLPENVFDSIAVFDASAAERLKGYQATDCGLIVALEKVYDTPYVPPLDVRTGTTPPNAAIRDRYWSVFKPDPFSRYSRHAISAGRRVWRAIKRKARSI